MAEFRPRDAAEKLSALQMLAAQPLVIEPRPQYAWEREPELYQGEVRNPSARPADRFQSAQAEVLSPTMGGYGIGQMAGAAYLHGREGEWAEAAENAAPLLAMGVPGAKLNPKGIRAFHGSPHDFDRFDASKIGTGEGAQAYGHGLYFAESEGVAKSYKDTNTPRIVQHWLDEAKGDRKEAVRLFDEYARDKNFSDVESIRKAIENPGRMYEVRLNAEPEQFLDWDKPLSQQSEAVRGLFRDAGIVDESLKTGAAYERAGNRTAQRLLGTDQGEGQFSTGLREAGIPGIRYLDQGSRGKAYRVELETSRGPYRTDDPATFGSMEQAQRYAADKAAEGFKTNIVNEGTYNYVVFPGNEHLVDIVKKYGIAGAAAMLGLSQTDVAEAMQSHEGSDPSQPLSTPPSPYESTQDRMHELQNEMRRLRGLDPVAPFDVPAPDYGNEIAILRNVMARMQ